MDSGEKGDWDEFLNAGYQPPARRPVNCPWPPILVVFLYCAWIFWGALKPATDRKDFGEVSSFVRKYLSLTSAASIVLFGANIPRTGLLLAIEVRRYKMSPPRGRRDLSWPVADTAWRYSGIRPRSRLHGLSPKMPSQHRGWTFGFLRNRCMYL